MRGVATRKRSDIEAYARGAIECLTKQLQEKRTERRRAQLKERIATWELVLKRLSEGAKEETDVQA